MASCLAAIQAQNNSGAYNGDAGLQALLNTFEKDLLRRLFVRTRSVLAALDGKSTDSAGNFRGEFEPLDFSSADFNTGTDSTGALAFGNLFLAILADLAKLNLRISELADLVKLSVDAALIPVLDAFDELQTYLDAAGLNPCDPVSSFYYNNSSSLYLHAAGSNGENGIPAGIHLRWSLTGELGENHIPRGDYEASGTGLSGYNLQNDYVQLSRSAYTPIKLTLDLETNTPVIDASARSWTYIVNHSSGGTVATDRIKLFFSDQQQYDSLLATSDPVTDHFGFLKSYDGLLEAEVKNKRFFTLGLVVKRKVDTLPAVLKLRAISVVGTTQRGDIPSSIRRTFKLTTGSAISEEMMGNDLYRVHIKKDGNAYLQSLSFETYHDQLKSKTETDWTAIGSGFSLSVEDSLVFDRLEAPAYPVDNSWPQYTGGSKVRVQNYKDKWLDSVPDQPSLKEVVERYLLLSRTDPRAMDTLRSIDADPVSDGLEISYVDVLNLMAMDYHIARMLGLGHIDTTGGGSSIKYIFKITYTAPRLPGSAETETHEFLSLPVSKADYLLPLKPVIRPLNYAFPQADELSNGMVDESGYSIHAEQRIVNVGRQPFAEEIGGYDFFADLNADENDNEFIHPRPVLYGVEYRLAGQSTWQKPAITDTQNLGHQYFAYNGAFPEGKVKETIPVPDNPDSLYIHMEQQNGVHEYAIYGIDLLGRVSENSDTAQTDVTLFPEFNRLSAPDDFNVHYIQVEPEPLFSTQREQYWLDHRIGQFGDAADVSFTRVNFNWLDITDISYLQDPGDLSKARLAKPDKVQALFKIGEPQEVTGVIINALPVFGNHDLLRLFTGIYDSLDGSPVNPNISPVNFDKFHNSILSTKEGQFKVQAITAGTLGPVITIEKNYNVELSEDGSGTNLYAARKVYIAPEINSRFSMIENLSDTTNWELVHNQISLVDLGDTTAPVIETETNSEGYVTRKLIGGVYGPAAVTPVESNPDGQPSLPGYYKIQFQAVSLAPHPQVNLPFDPEAPGANNPSTLQTPHVEWNNGLIRMPLTASASDGSVKRKSVQVIKIEQFNPLLVYAYDASYAEEPVRTSTPEAPLVPGVNFHPGYRAYLFPEPAPGSHFNRSDLLPASDTLSKKILFGMRSVNSRSVTGLVSKLSVPAVLLTRSVIKPEQLNAPILETYKVRPDMTGKAAFSMDARIEPDNDGLKRFPFGFMFYRTNDEEVYRALYQPDTIADIKTRLSLIENDPDARQRASDMVNLRFDPNNDGHFSNYGEGNDSYALPDPDKAGLTDSADNPNVKYDKYLKAVRSTLLPLSEQTIINQFVRTGHQTENKLPTIKDINGNLLNPSSPNFDPFPMVRKFDDQDQPNTYYIRLTDYNLSGTSRSQYFYTCAEVDYHLITGRLSYLAGPVTILNTLPAPAPIISSSEINMVPDEAGNPVTVSLRISSFTKSDQVNKIRLYRTTDLVNADSPEHMQLALEIGIDSNWIANPVISDNFSELPRPLIGKTIFYRVVYVRTIINEKEHTEDILSLPSELLTIIIVDFINPEAPVLRYEDSKLKWDVDYEKATYYLYQQNSRGNWAMISKITPAPGVSTAIYPLPGLVTLDEDGNRIYNRFKVKVENASGLMSLADKETTI
ncbi:hypothetical protein [Mucilaginibacter psychrotolerans]|uniref:Uncharacterized protein n=1 Tax=Mucilaginibacter psychrotolerans TaxID=1524096 RepID=A0A4Y8S5G6_9SPHI|nr:hypothetical protein [Mucilaginibacter psychrotolerans]TFF33976.1 hypothetical protein E2R66_23640 [Mucilaginibacter psychrotolerans]